MISKKLYYKSKEKANLKNSKIFGSILINALEKENVKYLKSILNFNEGKHNKFKMIDEKIHNGCGCIICELTRIKVTYKLTLHKLKRLLFSNLGDILSENQFNEKLAHSKNLENLIIDLQKIKKILLKTVESHGNI